MTVDLPAVLGIEENTQDGLGRDVVNQQGVLLVVRKLYRDADLRDVFAHLLELRRCDDGEAKITPKGAEHLPGKMPS